MYVAEFTLHAKPGHYAEVAALYSAFAADFLSDHPALETVMILGDEASGVVRGVGVFTDRPAADSVNPSGNRPPTRFHTALPVPPLNCNAARYCAGTWPAGRAAVVISSAGGATTMATAAVAVRYDRRPARGVRASAFVGRNTRTHCRPGSTR